MSGKHVIVTGARGRLGRALCSAFAAGDWHVWAANRKKGVDATPAANDNDKVEADSGALTESLRLDLQDDASIEAAAAQVFATDGIKTLALVANASNREALRSDWRSAERAHLHGVFDIDVVGHFLLARALRERAVDRQISLRILLVGSIYGVGGVNTNLYPEGMASAPIQYTLAKAALIGMTKDLAMRWGKDNILVNCLVPGGLFAHQDPRFVERYSEQTSLGRMGEFNEVARTALVLCSDDTSYVTGQVICADGGFTAW